MRLHATSSGSYPRIGDRPEEQVLRKAIAGLDRGEKTEADLEEARRTMVGLAIGEQEAAGLDIVTDGQIGWYDPVSHMTRSVAGVEIGGLLRYFDTNSYFRQPVIVGPIEMEEPRVVQEYRYATGVATKPVKPVLTGAYTLAKLSINRQGVYRDLEALCEAISSVVVAEVAALAEAGAQLIQIDEPCILNHPEELPLVEASLEAARAAAGSAALALYTSFGDATPLLSRLVELPVDVLGLDFTYSPGLIEAIASQGSPKTLGLGLLDARNTKMEEEEEIVALVEGLLPAVATGEAYLNPSTGLEYLPREKARAKCDLIGRICRRLNGGSS
ncbi:methylcobamide--CoM methyltransferase [Nitrospinae bacterium AH_259_B05_G02_I21]|nr:methylcobamide--CoM methyltransferase [Nitrospinae bacterium AH_259_B05_G02_I21]